MAQKNCGCGQDPCITFGAEMPIYDINWDTDGEIIPEDGEGNELPSTVMVPSDLEEDEIADYLSDKYGWLVLGFVKGQKYGSEEDGYTFAYSQGHNDGRKNIGYNQQLSSSPEQKHFRKILSQRAESFDPADAWDNHIHQEELALEAYEEYLEEVSEQDEPLSFEDWYEQTMAIYDTPEYDEYLEKQYLQMQEGAEELERQLKTLEAEGFTDTLKKVAPAIAAIVGVLGGLRVAGFKPKRR